MINNRWKRIQREKNIYLPSLNKNPIISKKTKVCLMGSCFADEMGWVLAENNINIGKVEYIKDMRHVIYPWGTFFSPRNMYDVLDICFNENMENFFDENSFIRTPQNLIGNHYESLTQIKKNDKFKLINLYFKARLNTHDYIQAKNEIKNKLSFFKESILNADVVIITLGLIENWIDKKTNRSWHSFHGNALKKKSIEDLAFFERLSFDDVCEYLNKIINIINKKDKKKIIFTVSPIPLNFTFTDQDIVIANRYSKSILRSAVEKFINNKNIFYFPSFEIVQDCVGWPKSFKDDKRHVKVEVFREFIAPKFIESFTNFEDYKI